MWNGFCGNLIRRSNRNFLIAALLLLVIAGVLGWFNAQYLLSIFRGPRAIDPASFPAGDSGKLINTFARIPVRYAVETGIQHITTNDSHPSGEADSEYVATPVNGHVLIIRISEAAFGSAADPKSGDLPAATYEGRFVPVSSDLRSKVADSLSKNDNLPPILPVYLDTVEYKSDGYIVLVFGLTFLLLGLWLLWRFLQFSSDYSRHTFARRLARYGQLEMLVQEVDNEAAGAHTTYGRRNGVVLTPRWLITQTNWSGVPARLDHVVWTYHHVMKRKLYFVITIAKWHSLITYDDFGNKSQVRMKEQQVLEALREVANRAPQAIIGYDKRLISLWRRLGKDKRNFLSEARNIISPNEPLQERKTTTLMGG